MASFRPGIIRPPQNLMQAAARYAAGPFVGATASPSSASSFSSKLDSTAIVKSHIAPGHEQAHRQRRPY
jgi:hypothetical protein